MTLEKFKEDQNAIGFALEMSNFIFKNKNDETQIAIRIKLEKPESEDIIRDENKVITISKQELENRGLKEENIPTDEELFNGIMILLWGKLMTQEEWDQGLKYTIDVLDYINLE